MKKLIFISVCLFIFSSCDFFKKGQKDEKGQAEAKQVIAKVNGMNIYLDDFVKKYNVKVRQQPEKYKTKEGKKEVIDEIAQFQMLYKKAKDLGLDDDYQVKTMMVRKLINEKVQPDNSLNEEEIENYYNTHKDDFQEIRASHILFKTGPAKLQEMSKGKATPPTFEEIDRVQLEKAKEILARARKGEDFTKLANQYSEGPTNVKGGDLGYFTQGRMIKEFSDAAFALKAVGDISDIIRTSYGYHIIKLTDRRIQPYISIKALVRSEILKNKREESYKQLVDDVMKDAKVTYYFDKVENLE